jgi:hypothetical protein
MPFQSASKILLIPTSASSSLAGQIGAWLLAQPIDVAPARRSSIAARPWARSRWWAAGRQSNSSALPGAWVPMP